MNVMNRTSALALGALMALGTAAWGNEPPAFLEFVRPLGMGGAFTAVADDHNVFSYNPAGMVQRTGAEFTLVDVQAGISQDFVDALNYVSDHQDDFKNFNTLPAQKQADIVNDIANRISQLNPRASAGVDIASFVSGPKFFGLPVHGGFGAFGIVNFGFHLDNEVVAPVISYDVTNDIVLPFSLAKRWNAPGFIPGKIGVGVTGKFLMRNQIRQDRISVLTLDNLKTPPLQRGKGIGSDVGFLYQPTDRTNVGLMIRDFLGTKISFQKLDPKDGFQGQPERDTVIRPNTDIGVAVRPKKLLWLLPTGERWMFAADVRDVMASDQHVFFQNGFKKVFGDNAPTHIHLGAEFRYWFLRFRGGAYQGYPTLGLGIDIPLLKIDYAFYSRELGERAGDIREKNHVISVALRFGSGATEARERIAQNKEERKQRKEETTPDVEMTPASTPASSTPPAGTPTGKPAKSDVPADKPATSSAPASPAPSDKKVAPAKTPAPAAPDDGLPR